MKKINETSKDSMEAANNVNKNKLTPSIDNDSKVKKFKKGEGDLPMSTNRPPAEGNKK